MKAVVISAFGGPENLVLQEVPTPEPQRQEVRVKVKATAVNRADVIQRMGRYAAPPDCPATIPGLEFAGVVDAIADGVDGFDLGDRVFGLIGGGSYAQYVTVHHRTLARIPDNLTFEEAAAIPEAFVTAYDAMVTQCKLSAGEWVLIHAVGSGVGTAAVQIAEAIGARSIGTSRTNEKLDKVREFGISHGLLVKEPVFAEEVKSITGGAGVHVVLELVGGSYVAEDLECVATKGRIIVVGLLAGAKVDFNLGKLLTKRVNMRGTTLRARPIEEKIAAGQLLEQNIAPLVESEKLRPVIDKIYDLADASKAHSYMESDDNFGKIVLKVND